MKKGRESTSSTVALGDIFLCFMSAGRTSVSDTTWPDGPRDTAESFPFTLVGHDISLYPRCLCGRWELHLKWGFIVTSLIEWQIWLDLMSVLLILGFKIKIKTERAVSPEAQPDWPWHLNYDWDRIVFDVFCCSSFLCVTADFCSITLMCDWSMVTHTGSKPSDWQILMLSFFGPVLMNSHRELMI